MTSKFQFILFLLLVQCWAARIDLQRKYKNLEPPPKLNDNPIIGILSQELTTQIYRLCTLATYRSYIAASYVKYIESAGARVVPIKIGQIDHYYEEIVNSVNGILFPGGGANFINYTNGYGVAAKKLYDLAIKRDVPIWGTCLGFDTIIYIEMQQDIRSFCNLTEPSIRVKFEQDYANSRLFKKAPHYVLNSLKLQSFPTNLNSYCLVPKKGNIYKLRQHWMLLTTSRADGVKFITAIESKIHKVWAVQFYPEKTVFEWGRNYNHDPDAILVGQYFANFFVDQARLNHNNFTSKRREESMLIYNYVPLYSAKHGCPYEQCYVFV